MLRSQKLISGILLSALLSFSVFPQTVRAQNSLNTHASVNLIDGPTPVDPNKIRDPYDPDDYYPGDPNDPTNDGTGSVGQLTIDYASNLRFGKHELKQSGITANALNTHAMIQITDGRGNGNGWALQLKPDFLVGEQTGTVLDKGYIYIGTTAIRKPSANVSAPPIAKTQRVPLGQLANIVVAPKNTGMSTWTVGLNQNTGSPTSLVINDTTNALADHYVGSLQWTLTNAPS